MALKGKTPADAAGIRVEGDNKMDNPNTKRKQEERLMARID